MRLQLVYQLFFVYVVIELCWANQKYFNSITDEDIESALRHAQEKVREEKRLEKELIAKGRYLDPSIISAKARHQLRGGHPGIHLDNTAQSILEAATADLVSRFGLGNEDIEKLSKISLNGEIGRQVSQQCLDDRVIECNPNSTYRTIDGNCNNLQRPNDGRTSSCLQRLLPPQYEDGVSAPRSRNNTLPNPRNVSIMIHRITPPNRQIDECNLSAWHMSFGQFVDHDLEFTIVSTLDNNVPINCCPISNNNHEACFPIRLNNDPDFNRDCMNFVRNIQCPQCGLGLRQQVNALTSFIDCSQVYGTSDRQAASLRTNNSDGKLLSRIISGVGERPPPSENPQTDQCSRENFTCFFLGDFRANQNPLLLAHHIIFVIFHNQLVDQLSKLNPRWDGERKYQEARRIVIACFQHIIYNEYLPLVIGEDAMRSFSLAASNTQYDPELIPTIINVFGAAAFRFGHSTVMDYFLTLSETSEEGRIEFRDVFFNPIPMYQAGVLEDIVRGSVRQPQQEFDNRVARSVTQFLYRRLNVTDGLDLASINIQRGRDHGLPGYTAYVKRVHNFYVNSFNDLINKGLLSQACIDAGIDKIYRSVHDVDVWTGLLCEPNNRNALVGPTTQYLIGRQFFLQKYGDRYFYTHRQEAGKFTEAQQSSITRVTFARIICNTLQLPEIGQAVFKYNYPIVSCSNYQRIPTLDIRPWRETRRSGK